MIKHNNIDEDSFDLRAEIRFKNSALTYYCHMTKSHDRNAYTGT